MRVVYRAWKTAVELRIGKLDGRVGHRRAVKSTLLDQFVTPALFFKARLFNALFFKFGRRIYEQRSCRRDPLPNAEALLSLRWV